MSQSAFSTSTMAFTNTSRSFTTNLGTTTTSDNKTNTLTSTFPAKNGGWGSGSSSIWGSGSLSNGLSSREATRNNSRSRDTRPSSSDEEVIEGKTGSGSLVDSSVSDGWNRRGGWGGKRSLPSGRSLSHVQYPEASTFQPRSASNAGLPTSFSSAMQNPTTFASGPPAISLNAPSTSSAQPRTGFNAPYSFGFSSRVSEQPPNIYTKGCHPADPKARKLPDSAKDGLWPDYSPTDERPPSFAVPFGSRTASTDTSRAGSIPSPRYVDEQPSFTKPDYSRASQRPTQNNSRAPSISSQNSGAYNGFVNSNADQMAWHLSQLNLNTNGRPLTSHKSSIGSAAMFNQASPLSASSPFSRSAISGSGLADESEEVDNLGANYFNMDSYQSPQQASAFSDYPQNRFGSRDTQTPTTNERQLYINGAVAPHLLEMPNGARPNAPWTPMADSGIPASRRLQDLQEQPPYVDFRLQNQILAQQLRHQYQPVYNPHTMQQALQLNGTTAYVPMMPMMPLNIPPVEVGGDARDLTPRTGESMQSLLMYEFKSNSKSRRYELKDIYDHIAEFSGDQHGSRFIQTKLETANSDEKERVFKEIEPNAIQLMTDVFGNYVIQKFFEHGDQRHKKILANKMKGEVLNLSLQMYGCRVVQKALDHVLVDQQRELVRELEGQVLKCVKDQNGNHVIQKAIERCPSSTIGFIIQAFRGDVQHLSIHPYGCRVIQRCLERCEPGPKAMIMEELMACIETLISDQYGNYVVQHVVQHDEGRGKKLVLDMVGRGLEAYSKHKFASNVVEKCLEKSDDMWRRQVLFTLANSHPQRGEGEGVFVSMIKDSYGNYVIQTLLDTLNPDDYLQFVDLLQPALAQAKRTGCGKQVLSIEKKMHKFPHYRGGPANGGAYNTHTYRIPLPPQFNNQPDSAGTTPPMLTADTQSLQSSKLPSIDGDTVEGATAICSRKASEQSPPRFFQ